MNKICQQTSMQGITSGRVSPGPDRTIGQDVTEIAGSFVQSQGSIANGNHPHETDPPHVPRTVDTSDRQFVSPDPSRSGDNAGAEVVVKSGSWLTVPSAGPEDVNDASKEV